MSINKNEIFVGDILPENPGEHEQTYEDLLDELQREFNRDEVCVNDTKSKLAENKALLGQLMEYVSRGEANEKDYEFINSVKDTIASSGFHLSEILREQNHIRDLIGILMEERNERNKKLTTLKDEQKN